MSALNTLPLEILFRVLDLISDPHDSSSSCLHPLNSLAAANKHFDSAVEEYTRALLKQYAGFAPKKRSKTYTSRKKWLAETCQLCYKTSKRRSTLWNNLTCCLACDKKHFPKITMTNAIKYYNLSKLDLFTPNSLHPTLPPLAHGEYPVMGGVATMIYEPDLIVRRRYLGTLLGDTEWANNANAQRRIRRHDQLVAHMEVAYSSARKVWYRSLLVQKEGKTIKKSLETKDSRDKFVRTTLKAEWAAMSAKISHEEERDKFLREVIEENQPAMHTQGTTQETAIEIK